MYIARTTVLWMNFKHCVTYNHLQVLSWKYYWSKSWVKDTVYARLYLLPMILMWHKTPRNWINLAIWYHECSGKNELWILIYSSAKFVTLEKCESWVECTYIGPQRELLSTEGSGRHLLLDFHVPIMRQEHTSPGWPEFYAGDDKHTKIKYIFNLNE